MRPVVLKFFCYAKNILIADMGAEDFLFEQVYPG